MGKDGEITSQQTEPEAIHVPAQYLQNVSSLQEYLQKVCFLRLFWVVSHVDCLVHCFALEKFQFRLLWSLLFCVFGLARPRYIMGGVVEVVIQLYAYKIE